MIWTTAMDVLGICLAGIFVGAVAAAAGASLPAAVAVGGLAALLVHGAVWRRERRS